MQHLKHAIRLLTALAVSIAALALSSCSDDFWKYKITYSTEHGITPAAIEVESGTLLTSAHLPTLTADGYTFDGWKDTTQQIKITEGYTIKSDLNLVAQWTEAATADDMCTITYVSMIGTEPESKSVEKNTKLTSTELPTLTDSEGKYDFVGWYNKTDNKRTIISANSEKVITDIILVAKWSVKGEESGSAENITWLSATAGDEKVTLKWTYPSADFSKVTICVSKKQGAYAASDLVGTKIIECTGDDIEECINTHTFTGLANGTTYWFRVTATNKSNVISATPVEISATPTASSTTGGTGNTGSDDSDKGGLIIRVQ